MKNVTQFIYGLLLLIISSNLAAQSSNEASSFLKLLAQPNTQADTMRLRWIVSDQDIWKEGISKGYSLTRYTTHLNGTAVMADSIRKSEVILGSNLFPFGEEIWESQFPNNDFAKVAKGTLYEMDSTTVLSAGAEPSLADAVNAENSEEARFIFGLFAAEQDFEVAKGMGLGYCDATIQAGATYIYRLSLNGTDIATAISIEADDAITLPAIDTLLAEGMDKAVILEWDIAETEDYYSSYTLERSTDGVIFAPLSNLPFIFSSDDEEAATTAVFKDSIANNEMVYYYRIKGRTPFGVCGPPSSVVQVKGVPSRISPFFLSINDHQATDNSVLLSWENFQGSLEFRLQGFNLYRSETVTTTYELVNPNIIAPSERSFTDVAPLSSGYYILEAIDDNGYSYESPAALVQLPDSIPPAIPVGLTGKFVSSERVQLTWQANSEPDFKGYRLFVANGGNANFTQITSQAIATEQYVYEIEPEFIVDSIYFKILSSDLRDNYSDKSDYVAIKRPDIVPPSNPVLQKVNPTPTGIELGWRFSSSEDVAYHLLERKAVTEPGWTTVLNISKNQEAQYATDLNPESIAATCYLDTDPTLERRAYDYRFKAFDQDGNMSSSKVITIRPFDNGQRGSIENFSAKAECLPVGTIQNQEGYDALSRLLGEYEYGGAINQDSLMKIAMWQIINNEEYLLLKEQDPYEVKVFLDKRKMEIWEGSIIAQVNLMWAYGVTDELQDFQIYRSSEGSPIMLYKTLPLETLSSNSTTAAFLDEDIRPNRRYYYQIVARHRDGGFSEKSPTLMVKVPKF